MAMECLTEFAHTHMDRRPRKRPRLLGWDVLPGTTEVVFLFLLRFLSLMLRFFYGSLMDLLDLS